MKICSICKKNQTDIKCDLVKSDDGAYYNETIHVCKDCLEDSKTNFIFLCVTCRKIYKRDKADTINRLIDSEIENIEDLVRGLNKIKDDQIIMGVSSCIVCDREVREDQYFNYKGGIA